MRSPNALASRRASLQHGQHPSLVQGLSFEENKSGEFTAQDTRAGEMGTFINNLREIKMTEIQRKLAELQSEQSRHRQRLSEIALMPELDDAVRREADSIQKSTPDLERRIQAALIAVQDEAADSIIDEKPENREFAELRDQCRVGNFITAALRGQKVTGPESEYNAERGLSQEHISFDLWENRAVTAAPTSGTGVNLGSMVPAVFAPSVADYLKIDMPTVPSGAHSTARISTSVTSGAVAAGADVPETAGAWESFTSKPHRVGASLNLAIEDVASVGNTQFESLLREHISLSVSNELNKLLITGAGSGNDPFGLIGRKADPTNPSAVAKFDDFLAVYANEVDGLFAESKKDVRLLMGVGAYRLAAKSFRDAGNAVRGATAFDDYAMAMTGGLRTSALMPAASSNIEKAIAIKTSMAARPSGLRYAECVSWGYFSIDDVYTGARAGQRRLVISALCGDVVLLQPAAYSVSEFKIA